jgi:hypothetical protein
MITIKMSGGQINSLKRGDILYRSYDKSYSLVIDVSHDKCGSVDMATDMLLQKVSKNKLVQRIQKWYYLNIKFPSPKK